MHRVLEWLLSTRWRRLMFRRCFLPNKGVPWALHMLLRVLYNSWIEVCTADTRAFRHHIQ